MGKVLKSNSTAKNPHETRENNEPTLQTRMHRVAVQIASTSIGQTMMMQLDKLLWTFEKTSTWISNGKTGDGKTVKASVGLVRPLPWVFFLPTLVALRFTRIVLSLVAISIGFNEIEASMMVSFLHESRRNMRHILVEAKRNRKSQISFADYVKQITLTSLTKLSNFISPTPNETVKVIYNNKTSLNASVITETENDDRTTSQSEESDMEEKVYKNFLRNDIDTSDSDDEDYLNELNGEYISDSDSQDSVATEDLSDDEKKLWPNVPSKNENGSAADHDDSKHSADTSSLAVKDSLDAQPSSKEIAQFDAIDPMDRLLDGDDAKGVAHNRGKNVNRPHKNGRNHAKTQNNGKHFNGAHGQKVKTADKQHQVESTTDFLADANAVMIVHE